MIRNWRAAVLGVGLAWCLGCGEKAPRVETAKVVRKDLSEKVRANGRVRPKVSVDVSSNVIGRVVKLCVREGQTVAAGDTLIRIDPTTAQGRLQQAEAEVTAARAGLSLEQSRYEETKADLARKERLFENHLAPESELITARTNNSVQAKTIERLKAQLEVATAALRVAHHDLGEVTVRSEMNGIVVRLSVEEGENVVPGTMNNQGTVLMTIADLSSMECEVLVDETDVVDLRVGQQAQVTIDAFPDTTLRATVTEVGNSAAQRTTLGTQSSTDFKVVLLVEDLVQGLRPDLTATAEIVIAERHDAPAVPIRAVTLRDPKKEAEAPKSKKHERSENPEGSGDAAQAMPSGDGVAAKPKDRDIVDGVFVLDARKVRFQPISVGVTGEQDFEVLDGVKEGDEIIVGPFETLRRLATGDKVRVRNRDSRAKG